MRNSGRAVCLFFLGLWAAVATAQVRGASLNGGRTFLNPTIDGSLATVDFYVQSLPSPVAAGGWEAHFSLLGPGRFVGAIDAPNSLDPYTPGAPPSIVGVPGTELQLLDLSPDLLAENTVLARVQVRVNSGSTGVLTVTPNPQFTTLADATGTAIPLTQLTPGEIIVGAFLGGDADLDGESNLTDFVIVKSNFGQIADRFHGDLTGDGLVDLADFDRLSRGFGRAGGATWSGGESVPEPSAALLVVLGAAALFLCRDRIATYS